MCRRPRPGDAGRMPRTETPGRPDEIRRGMQFAFAAFSLAAAALLWSYDETAYPTIKSGGMFGHLLATAVVLGAALAGARRTLIAFHLLFVPVQFLFLFAGGLEEMAGMVFSAVIVARMRPRFPQLKRLARRVWLTLHVGVSVGWLGLALAMTTLAITGATADDHAVRHGSYELMHVFDLTIVIPSVVLAVVTGLVVSLGTPWGLVKHRWVLLKFVISLVIPVIATVQSGWIEELQHRTADPAADPGGTGLVLVLCMLLYAALLWTAVVLSVFKPGGKTRWGRTERARRPRAAPARADRGGTPESTVSATP
ncbi:hypothetical protein SAMN04489713_110197 [Actinomadura madurae]|uniref:Uncharacterized protein n=2 Tax=Actinomadura madurae TaxID=1993 RepID=A0A1I5KZS4_9ACTN|nr:hypothetical protein SAMN04489713_110197 [Actinomadura madurae]